MYHLFWLCGLKKFKQKFMLINLWCEWTLIGHLIWMEANTWKIKALLIQLCTYYYFPGKWFKFNIWSIIHILFHFTVHRDQMRGMAIAHVQSQSSTTRQRVPSKTYEEGKVSTRDVTFFRWILKASVRGRVFRLSLSSRLVAVRTSLLIDIRD